MKKLSVRLTIVLTAIYFVVSFIVAQFFGIDIFSDFYVLLFEFCVCLYCQDEPKYHCKHIKRLCWLIFAIDVFVRFDNVFNLVSVSIHNIVPLILIVVFTLVHSIQSLIHYIKVRKIKKLRNGKHTKR